MKQIDGKRQKLNGTNQDSDTGYDPELSEARSAFWVHQGLWLCGSVQRFPREKQV